MFVELDQETVRTFVIFRHQSLAPRREIPPRADPLLVGKIATQLASKVLGGVCDGDQCKVAECAGLLIYAMDGYGLNYEEVCGVACRKVAEVLRQITPDHRETEPLRYRQLHNAVVGSDALTLIVKLAEIMAVLDRIPLTYDATTMASRALDLKNWVDRTDHLLEAMKALKDIPRLTGVLDKVHDGLTKIAQRAEAARVQVKAQGRAQREEEARQASDAGPGRRPGTPSGERPRPLERLAAHA